MKILTGLVLLVFASSVFASNKFKTVTTYSKLAMENVLISYNNLCINSQDQLQTIAPVEVCVEKIDVGGHENGSQECVATEYRILTKDIFYRKATCTKESGNNKNGKFCSDSELEDAVLKTYYFKTVTRYRWRGSVKEGDWDFPGKVLSEEKIQVPNCQ